VRLNVAKMRTTSIGVVIPMMIEECPGFQGVWFAKTEPHVLAEDKEKGGLLSSFRIWSVRYRIRRNEV